MTAPAPRNGLPVPGNTDVGMPHPRRWWAGALDVERLAWSAVTSARSAAARLAAAEDTATECTATGPAPGSATVQTSPELVAASFAGLEHLRVDGREPQGWAPMSGFFAARDGWVRVHANYPHHAAAVSRVTGATTREGLIDVLGARSAVEVEEAITAERGIAVAVRSPEEWAAHPHGLATANDPWSLVEITGDARARRGTRGSVGTPWNGQARERGATRGKVADDTLRERRPSTARPLHGVRVLDLTRVIAGPTASQLLACLGADVLRLDPPGRPELLDQHLSNGMGKRSVVADLADASTRSKVEDLITDADMVLLGYRPGALDRWGLSSEALHERHPGLIVGVLSAWGEHGPWAHRPGFDSIVQAACGIAVLTGDGERPGALPVQALDHASGQLLAAGVMTLLADRTAGTVRVSLLGAARTLLSYPPPPDEPPAQLTVPRVEVDSPHGRLLTVPPPLTIDGATLERPVGGYGAASLQWADAAPQTGQDSSR